MLNILTIFIKSRATSAAVGCDALIATMIIARWRWWARTRRWWRTRWTWTWSRWWTAIRWTKIIKPQFIIEHQRFCCCCCCFIKTPYIFVWLCLISIWKYLYYFFLLPSAWAWNRTTSFLAAISSTVPWSIFVFRFHRRRWFWPNPIRPKITYTFDICHLPPSNSGLY